MFQTAKMSKKPINTVFFALFSLFGNSWTQTKSPFVFTPDWIVHYMVENSLGRLWLEGHPNDALKSEWKYYLDEAEQEAEVQAQLATIRKEYAALKPEEIRVIDPCMGSGHILCVLFDVLVRIYEDYGYTAREAAVKIVENNLWGLDIDERAAQLSYFAVMMKARQYDRRFFTRKAQPHVYAIEESNGITSEQIHDMGLDLTHEEHDEAVRQAMRLVKEMHDAKEYGSIIHITPCDWDLLRRFVVHKEEEGQLQLDINGESEASERIHRLIEIGKALSQHYDVVTTNPPYMNSSGMDKKLLSYVKKNYDDGRNDLYTVFILRCLEYANTNRFVAMITQQGWLGLTRSAQLRGVVYSKSTYVNMLHLGAKAFEDISGEVVQTAAFVLSKNILLDYKSTYCKLTEFSSSIEKETAFKKKNSLFYATSRENQAITGYPLSYWLPRTMLQLFLNSTVGEYFDCRCGMATGDNGRFIRFWYEPSKGKLTHFSEGAKWALYNKGGSQRRWYGNYDLVVNWENNGFDIKENKRQRLERGEIEKKNSECWNSEYYFREGITWSAISSGAPMFRYDPSESLFDTKGPTCFCAKSTSENEMFCLMGYLNSKVAESVLSVLAPTLDCNPGIVAKLPYRPCGTNQQVLYCVKKNMELSKTDWDSYELSWDYKEHPFITQARKAIANGGNTRIKQLFEEWKSVAEQRFQRLKENEEELNRIFINIYDLGMELDPNVKDNEVTVQKADLQRDIRSFISYAVGCMFGRYSLDVMGLVYAGGEWNASMYTQYQPDKDAIIPICDDEYFEDDIVSRFVKFVEIVFGGATLEENLRFIADTLGGKGSSREVIRSYFINDFYKDHCKVYQKRPIYWLYDSGKNNGFKCLVYIHRYQPDTIARIRTDYVHEQQSRYRTAIADLEQRMNGVSTSERVKLNKQLAKLQAQAEEIRVYEEKIHHLADQMIKIDLDDGVKHNYAIFKDVLAKIK